MNAAIAAPIRCRCGGLAIHRLVLVALPARLGPVLTTPICAGCYAAEGWEPDARDVCLTSAAGAAVQGRRWTEEEQEP